MQTFLFYDVETSGLNPAFDQVLTFASIRTDLALNEIDRQTITVQLRKDIVPSPGAFLTHGLTHEELSAGISEYEAALKIHKLVNTPGTISIGYNSLGFDDEFLRFLFYRNLLDPYVHQYGNGCSRMDVLPIVVIFRVFHPQGVQWPQKDGKSSLKLELIARDNQLETSGRAHEAMNDVEALIGLSKLLIAKKEIWNYCLEFFNKTRDEVRVNTIDTTCDIASIPCPICLMASASIGSDANYLAPVIPLGPSSAYKNQNLWLRLDSDDILGLETQAEIEETFVIRKRYGDIPVILPALGRFWGKLPEASQSKVTKNLGIIGANMDRFNAYKAYHQAFKYPLVPDLDLDASLYQQGFFSALEKRESQEFHQSGMDEKAGLLSRMKSPRVRSMAHRILRRNFTGLFNPDLDAEYDQNLSRLSLDEGTDAIFGYKGDVKFNRSMAIKELDSFKVDLADPDERTRQMLDWLGAYIRDAF